MDSYRGAKVPGGHSGRGHHDRGGRGHLYPLHHLELVLLDEDGGVVYELFGGGEGVREGGDGRAWESGGNATHPTAAAGGGGGDELDPRPLGGGASRGHHRMIRGCIRSEYMDNSAPQNCVRKFCSTAFIDLNFALKSHFLVPLSFLVLCIHDCRSWCSWCSYAH